MYLSLENPFDHASIKKYLRVNIINDRDNFVKNKINDWEKISFFLNILYGESPFHFKKFKL